MSARLRPHNVTLTDEAWAHLLATYGKRRAAAALENVYRAAHGLAPRPDVAERGRFQTGKTPPVTATRPPPSHR